MPRAYIVQARNDIPTGSLQVLDLKPNTSQGHSVYQGHGQTGYLSFLPEATAVVSPGVGGFRTTSEAFYGLTAYLIDTIHSDPDGVGAAPNNCTLSDLNAVSIALTIFTQVSDGSPLTETAINTIATAIVGGANTGIGIGNSTATVEEILRILAGEVYRLPAGRISGAGAAPGAFEGGGFSGVRTGAFVTAPVVLRAPVANGPVVPVDLPVQTGTHDYRFQSVRLIYHTPDLVRSIKTGALSHLIQDTYALNNGAFTYGGGAHPAQKLHPVNIDGPTGAHPYQARAVTVYAADGSVIN